ncbi:SDR family NAD(P)-dependent oxidoreductase [Kordiimonas lacus]|uniref:Short-chain dehydrogenase n=1 Tax=Kordiimonas lacus TaxID=637679 RepID=A0A1G7A8A6_9PROT|nr:SDR family NAD(P)-dependent oxidoreductase [Kordiimonas lacus]SDE10717.1 Short-chain dehydrogenase [Kordiimonas lacus]
MIIWITGGSSGIGRELALQYLAAGHKVFVTARSADKLKTLAEEAKPLPGDYNWAVADVCDRAALKLAVATLETAWGVPDLAILNAGTHQPTSARQFDLATHERLMQVNYMGVLNCLEAVLPSMRARGRGQVALVASLAGYRGLPMASAYGASKAALINFAESIREELKLDGIDVRLVNPGFVKTPLTDLNDFPMPFLMPVDKAAARIVKGLAGAGFEVTFPTRFAFIMKLLRLLPDRLYLAATKGMARGD